MKGQLIGIPHVFLGLQTKVSNDFNIFPDPKPLFVATAAASSQQPAVQVILMLHRVQFNIAGREAAAGVGTLKEAHTHRNTHLNNKLPLNQHRPLPNAAVEDYFPPSMTAFQSL